MIAMDQIVGVIFVVGALVLIISHGRLRSLGWQRGMILAIVWIGLILAAVMLIRALGLNAA